MKTIKNLDQLYRLAGTHQVTVQELINKRTRLTKNGWQQIKLGAELLNELPGIVAEILGGHGVTQNRIADKVRYSRPQHWGLDRILLSQYGKRPARFSYCAGQDMPWELNCIRATIK